MTAYNVVRFKVKPGKEAEFVAMNKKAMPPAKGFRKGALIKTGDLDRGCAYLRVLGRNPLALSRAKAAGCPTD